MFPFGVKRLMWVHSVRACHRSTSNEFEFMERNGNASFGSSSSRGIDKYGQFGGRPIHRFTQYAHCELATIKITHAPCRSSVLSVSRCWPFHRIEPNPAKRSGNSERRNCKFIEMKSQWMKNLGRFCSCDGLVCGGRTSTTSAAHF